MKIIILQLLKMVSVSLSVTMIVFVILVVTAAATISMKTEKQRTHIAKGIYATSILVGIFVFAVWLIVELIKKP